MPNVPDDQSPLASGMSPAREADQQETCQKSRRDGDLVHRSVGLLIRSWRTRAQKKFADAESETDPMGKKLIEHGAMCYLNAAMELEEVLAQLPDASVPLP